MISLSTTQKIQLKISETGRDVDVLAAWVDTSTDLPASDETLVSTSGTNTVTDIIAAPSSGVRQVDLINIYNRDTDSVTVTVQQYNSTGTVTAVLFACVLAPGRTLQFNPRSGWSVSAVNGLISYTELTSEVSMTADYTDIVSAPTLTADGATPLTITFFAPSVYQSSARALVISLFDGSTEYGHIVVVSATASPTNGNSTMLYGSRRLIPTSGTHTYKVRGKYVNGSGAVNIQCGAGSSGNYMPGYIKIEQG